MLHNEARELLVEGYEVTHNAKETTRLFHVGEFTAYHLAELRTALVLKSERSNIEPRYSSDGLSCKEKEPVGIRKGASPM